MQLPALASISTFYTDTSPPKHVIRSFLLALQKVCTSLRLSILHLPISCDIMEPDVVMQNPGQSSTIDLDWNVDLKDSGLLGISSTCQRLKALDINETRGWRATGITPPGAVPPAMSVSTIFLALDTRGYTFPAVPLASCGMYYHCERRRLHHRSRVHPSVGGHLCRSFPAARSSDSEPFILLFKSGEPRDANSAAELADIHELMARGVQAGNRRVSSRLLSALSSGEYRFLMLF
ncbi:hypothetical protein JVT61DRAFT_10684 [Boletus reticuloceps]|uniref:Uncharacterized protein n=1 Tax=Boletus reticuloceps TaxID=495285 RepID=A0A8I3A570_9AGAM|nr:hypothetical protein JVT61DRAFT_10684 [Boletus reticuloceps]